MGLIAKKICKVEGCNNKHLAKGYCNKHWLQINRHGRILERTIYDSNEIIIKENFAEVVLYNAVGKERARAVIDIEDVAKVEKHKWSLSGEGYATVKLNKKIFGMQHIILGVVPERKNPIDHKNKNKLNNRKENLRICTISENVRNAVINKNNSSGYKGVTKHGSGWRAVIWANYKPINLGTFKEKIKAAIAYNEAALKYHKNFAWLNKV